MTEQIELEEGTVQSDPKTAQCSVCSSYKRGTSKKIFSVWQEPSPKCEGEDKGAALEVENGTGLDRKRKVGKSEVGVKETY